MSLATNIKRSSSAKGCGHSVVHALRWNKDTAREQMARCQYGAASDSTCVSFNQQDFVWNPSDIDSAIKIMAWPWAQIMMQTWCGYMAGAGSVIVGCGASGSEHAHIQYSNKMASIIKPSNQMHRKYKMKLIYVWTRMNGQGSPLENGKIKYWKNDKCDFLHVWFMKRNVIRNKR